MYAISSLIDQSDGFELDRFWVLSDLEGNQVTQRKHPRLALVSPRIKLNISSQDDIPVNAYQLGGQLIVSAPGMEKDLVIEFKNQKCASMRRQVQVWASLVDGLDEGDEAAEWFSKYLEMDVRLLVKDVSCIRSLDKRHVPARKLFSHEPQTAFSDGFPFLITNTASLVDLNAHLATKDISPVSMENFRPNIVITSPSLAPYIEETFVKLSVNGANMLYIASRCTRCILPNNNPVTGIPHVREPLATLMQYRRSDPGAQFKACFGMNAIQATTGWVLRTGDIVTVVEQGVHDQRGVWLGNETILPVGKEECKQLVRADDRWWRFYNALVSWWTLSIAPVFWSWWPY
ncbi:hypothetical protein SpCBS45565_g03380 [Spizellomyces sp. 'palustris']|nr:hypothetical protein SpCBS45565_g03380 [Spizellomyces sp. 'palustris']